MQAAFGAIKSLSVGLVSPRMDRGGRKVGDGLGLPGYFDGVEDGE
jgi:hypothetical protein